MNTMEISFMSIQFEEAVRHTTDRLLNKVGHTTKTRKKLLFSAQVARYFCEAGFTINFDPTAKVPGLNVTWSDLGITTIWRMIAYQMALNERRMPLKKPTVGLQWESAEKHHWSVQCAFKSIRKHVFDDRHLVLYILPRMFGQKANEVITIYPDYQVNPVQTAEQLRTKIEPKVVESYVRAHLNRQDAITGSRDATVKELRQMIEVLSREGLPQALFSFATEQIESE